MNPAFSVIFFTTASGAGYGLLAWLGLLAAIAQLPAQRGFLAVALGVSFLLISTGLMASTFHLGQPQRAWRAFSQWRSSWLSREGVAAMLCFVPLVLAAWRWVWLGVSVPADRILGLLLVLGAFATVYCTARIYTSLPTIQAWQHRLVLPGYLLLSGLSGGLLLLVIGCLALGSTSQPWPQLALVAAALALCAGVTKVRYWRALEALPAASSINSATGLMGSVRSFERPHTEENYLLTEMGFRLGRKHAARLRRLSLWSTFVVPIVALSALGLFGAQWFAALLMLALISCALGVVVERWLFFAQAKHVVTLYYE